MSTRTDRAVYRLLSALGSSKRPIGETIRLLRQTADHLEAAIGRAGGTVTINDGCELPGATRRPTIKERSNV